MRIRTPAPGRHASVACSCGTLLLMGGCVLVPRPAPMPEPLPPLPPPVAVAGAPALQPAPLPPAADPGPPVTLSAANVDVATLLTLLAEEAGVSLVIGPGVTGRVSVNLVEVPAREALLAVLEEAGLMILADPLRSPWEPVVFYTLPVNVERDSAAAIQARFGVSRELAEWVVESRRR